MVNTTELPKVELHCHLDGILDPVMARAIRRTDPDFPVDPADLEQAYPIKDYDSFWGWWRFVKAMDRNLRYFYPVIQQHIERLKAQNVRYAEVMIASGELPLDPLAAVDAVAAFREWANQHEDGLIQVEFLVAFGRNKSPEQVAQLAERLLALHRAGLVVGAVLAGPEPGNPVKPFQKTFARLHEAGLAIEIHAGEWVGPESIWDALQHGYPQRIGHGVSLFQDARLVEVFQERQIHIEMCPTSNLKTGSINRIEDHPIGRARELGLNISVNTDDPGPFLCSMNGEYDLLATTFGFDQAAFQQVYANSLAARFQPELRVPV